MRLRLPREEDKSEATIRPRSQPLSRRAITEAPNTSSERMERASRPTFRRKRYTRSDCRVVRNAYLSRGFAGGLVPYPAFSLSYISRVDTFTDVQPFTPGWAGCSLASIA